MRIRTADTPTRLVGADYEIDKRIWVDHKAGYFVLYRIAAWRFKSFPDSKLLFFDIQGETNYGNTII